MNPNNPNQKTPTVEELKAMDEELSKIHSVDFSKRELIAVFNILTQISMKYADSLVLAPIVKKLEPIVTQASNITMRPPTDEIIGAKESN